MIDPVFWLGVSILLVAVSIAAVLVAAMPAFQELARAARSAEKLFDTLNRELPPTLKSIRDTGAEISSLTDDMSEGVQGAGRVVQQVDQSIGGVTQKAQVTTRSVLTGVKAAWKTFSRADSPLSKEVSPKHIDPDRLRLPASTRPTIKSEEADSLEQPLKSFAEQETEMALSHDSDSVAKLNGDLESIRNRLIYKKSEDGSSQ